MRPRKKRGPRWCGVFLSITVVKTSLSVARDSNVAFRLQSVSLDAGVCPFFPVRRSDRRGSRKFISVLDGGTESDKSNASRGNMLLGRISLAASTFGAFWTICYTRGILLASRIIINKWTNKIKKFCRNDNIFHRSPTNRIINISCALSWCLVN